MSMAVSAALPMTTSVLEGREATTSPLVPDRATLPPPVGPRNDWHQTDTRPPQSSRLAPVSSAHSSPQHPACSAEASCSLTIFYRFTVEKAIDNGDRAAA
jgi:hypothetical protein